MGQNVSESDRRALKGLLEECQESMRQAVLQSSQHCFYSNIDQITGFTDRIIEDTTSKCDFLFSVDDIIEQIPVLSVHHAFKVYDCLCEVFTDLQQESLEQQLIYNLTCQDFQYQCLSSTYAVYFDNNSIFCKE